ncbi:helix-turn-helix domain-containing protein [uncultured Deinococcus sp.]|uniref:helix-turn-helix domain-containing protein n=1 Tax=uncultured Deinococcus sp. TaxID=158789 RepID=UPI00345BEBDB
MTAASLPAQPADEPNPFRLRVAGEVRAHLARRRISNRGFAAALGTTPAWIDRRLNGTTAMTTDDLELFAEALGISVGELLRDAVSTSASPDQGLASREWVRTPAARNTGRTTCRYLDPTDRTVVAFPQVGVSSSDDRPVAAPYGSCSTVVERGDADPTLTGVSRGRDFAYSA